MLNAGSVEPGFSIGKNLPKKIVIFLLWVICLLFNGAAVADTLIHKPKRDNQPWAPISGNLLNTAVFQSVEKIRGDRDADAFVISLFFHLSTVPLTDLFHVRKA